MTTSTSPKSFCPDCGTKNENAGPFCAGCGRNLAGPSTTTSDAPPSTPAAEAPRPTGPTPVTPDTGAVGGATGSNAWEVAKFVGYGIAGLIGLFIVFNVFLGSPASVRSNRVAVGETAKVADLRYSVGSVERDDKFGGFFSAARADGEFVVVQLTVENKGSKPRPFAPASIQLHAEDLEFHVSIPPKGEFHDAIQASGSKRIALQPGEKIEGPILFDVPPSVAERTDLEVHLGQSVTRSGAVVVELGDVEEA